MSGFDSTALNFELFSSGNIAMSPAEVIQLNSQSPTIFSGNVINAQGAGYHLFLTGYAQARYNLEKKLDFKFEIERTLHQLKSNPRPVINGFVKAGSVDTRRFTTLHFFFDYKISSGQIIVFNIELQENAQIARDSTEKQALYHIKRGANNIWRISKKIDYVTTELAAVNGQSNNLAKATWLMGEHLDVEFSKDKPVKEFTLFHNPSVGGDGDTWESVQDKLGFTTDVTKKFVKILQDVQANRDPVKWIAHSQGGIIFSEAVRYHLNNDSSWAILGGFNGALREKVGGHFGIQKNKLLDKHSVAMHGNANNNTRSEHLFRRAGIKVIAYRSHDYDMVNKIIGFNFKNSRELIGSAIYRKHVTDGSVAQSPHTLPFKGMDNWQRQMEHGPGRGRSSLQTLFENHVSGKQSITDAAIESVKETGNKAMKAISNYLK